MWCISVIALNTFRECLRDKILYNLLLFAILLMGGGVVLGDLTIMEHHKIVTDVGLAAINLAGVIIAIFVGIGLVSKEIEKRTVYTIMARPISRTQFVLGKYAGLIVTLFVNVSIMLAVFLFTLWMYQVPIHLAIFQAVSLIFVEVLIVTALALFFSTFSSATLSAIMTLGVFVIGHVTTDLKGIAEKSQDQALQIGITALYYAFPNFEMLNMKGQAALGIPISMTYYGLATIYGILFSSLLITGACFIFRHRDF